MAAVQQQKLYSLLFCDKPPKLIHKFLINFTLGKSAHLLGQTFQTCAETAVFTKMLINFVPAQS